MEVAELQLDLFAQYFDPDDAKWEARSYNPAHIECEVYVVIPESVKSPLEEESKRSFSEKRNQLMEIWNAHVWSILWAIPKDVKKDEDDANGWGMAYQLLKKHRISQEPIKVRIQFREREHFTNTVVVEGFE